MIGKKMIKRRTRSKVNLTLDVVGRRPDGYHDIRTVFQPVSLGDELTVEQTAGSDIEFSCSEGWLAGEDNIVCKAYRLMKERYSEVGGCRVHLDKHVPSGAGLGGGSGDAAAMLEALNEMFDIGASDEELRSIGAELGADVPTLMLSGASLGEGRGEMLTPIKTNLVFPLVFIKPEEAYPTGKMYGELDRVLGLYEAGHDNVETASEFDQNGDMFEQDKHRDVTRQDQNGNSGVCEQQGDAAKRARQGDMAGSDRQGDAAKRARQGDMAGSDRQGDMAKRARQGDMTGSDRQGDIAGSEDIETECPDSSGEAVDDLTDLVVRGLEKGDLDMICDAVFNVFELAVPDKEGLALRKELLFDAGAKAALMTGSGSCVYGIFSDEADAAAACEKLREQLPGTDRVFAGRSVNQYAL